MILTAVERHDGMLLELPVQHSKSKPRIWIAEPEEHGHRKLSYDSAPVADDRKFERNRFSYTSCHNRSNAMPGVPDARYFALVNTRQIYC